MVEYSRPVHKVAIVGGTPGHYVEVALTGFLQKLREKHPHVTIVTGSAKGAEAQVREWCELVGMKLEVPPVKTEFLGKDAGLLQVCDVLADADAIVIVGTKGGQRAKLATDIHKRVDGCRQPWNVRIVTNIGQPPVKEGKAVTRRAKKKVDE